MVDTFVNFLNAPGLVGDWITVEFAKLLFQNLIVEERVDIRGTTMTAWRLSIKRLSELHQLEVTITPALTPWFGILMNPIGAPHDLTNFYQPFKGGTQTHNVDKPMLLQDMSLVSEEAVLRGRIAGCKATAFLVATWPEEVSRRSTA